MRTPDRLYAKPLRAIDSFTFNESVARVFEDMIQRSVPGYTGLLEQLGIVVQHFVQPHSVLYDLGCSLGAVTHILRQQVRASGCRIIAIDNAPAMVAKCQAILENQPASPDLMPVSVQLGDLLTTSLEPCSVVVMNFTLQFIASSERLALLKRIRTQLLPGGALILSEKLSFTEAETQILLEQLHRSFKAANGYSALEIAQKRSALEHVLQPDTWEQHQKRLKTAGFTQIVPWFQCLNFASIIAVA